MCFPIRLLLSLQGSVQTSWLQEASLLLHHPHCTQDRGSNCLPVSALRRAHPNARCCLPLCIAHHTWQATLCIQVGGEAARGLCGSGTGNCSLKVQVLSHTRSTIAAIGDSGDFRVIIKMKVEVICVKMKVEITRRSTLGRQTVFVEDKTIG